jgi:hypothetical protein
MNTRTLVELLHYFAVSDPTDTEVSIQSRDLLPSGSGFDNGGYLVTEDSNDKRIVIRTSFHHMNEWGAYTFWTQHTIRIYPSFESPGFTLKVSGTNPHNIKEYIADVYYTALVQLVRFNGEHWVIIG